MFKKTIEIYGNIPDLYLITPISVMYALSATIQRTGADKSRTSLMWLFLEPNAVWRLHAVAYVQNICGCTTVVPAAD